MTWKSLYLPTLVLMFAPAFASAGAISMANGNFTLDEDVVLIPFTVSTLTQVTIQTTSFGDGSGGFEPILTLFDSLGNKFVEDSTGGTAPGGCGARSIDPISHFCLDSYIQATIIGSWTLAISEYDNIANGPTFLDGFPQTGNGNFTGPEFLGSPGSFILFDGSQRNSNWAVTINGVDAPEPGTGVLALSSALAIAFSARKVRASQQSLPSNQ